MLLCDWQIKERVKITPFVDKSPDGAISYGLSSVGYDLRLGTEFIYFPYGSTGNEWFLDPKDIRPSQVTRITHTEPFLLNSMESVLGTSVETIELPSTVSGICQGKSTLARCFILVPPTPIEPGFKGQVTLEITNLSPKPVRLYPGEGICQVLFFENEEPGEDYAEKGGIYQNQVGVTLPRVRGLVGVKSI